MQRAQNRAQCVELIKRQPHAAALFLPICAQDVPGTREAAEYTRVICSFQKLPVIRNKHMERQPVREGWVVPGVLIAGEGSGPGMAELAGWVTREDRSSQCVNWPLEA